MSALDETLTTDALVDEALALAGELDRPLRYVQLNSFYNGSTGTIMRNLHRDLSARGVDSYIFWGRRHKTVNDHEQCCATKEGVYLHGALSRLTDRAGFYSKRDTAKLLRRLDEINPDIVHLHNIHGYWINIEMLFGWLAKHHSRVRWTLHDCWSFTGHCAYFDFVRCDRWKSGCHHCPQRKSYPQSLLLDRSRENYREKRELFTGIPNLRLIVPSHWLESRVKESFLKEYPVEVVYHTIDPAVFHPLPSDFRKTHHLEDKKIILGVASVWDARKGLADFLELAKLLDDQFMIVLVGLREKQRKNLPANILALPRTGTLEELVQIYSAADVFVNPSAEETFGMTTLEARRCGTEAVVYQGTACEEIVRRFGGIAVPRGADHLFQAILQLTGEAHP